VARTHAALLNIAERECKGHRPASGWILFHNAEEWRVEGLPFEQLVATAVSLEQEFASESASDWRILAANDLIRQTSHRSLPISLTAEDSSASAIEDRTPASTRGPRNDDVERRDRALIRRAVQLRGQYYNNRYVALEVAAARRLYLLGIGIVFLFMAFAVAREHVSSGGEEVGFPWVVMSAVVAGVLGSTTSAIQRLASDPQASTSLSIGSFTSTVTRPFIGAVAALTVFLAVHGGLLNLEGDDRVAILILASFAAGFTERLVVYQGANK
jgi:hypothetical protein